MDTSPQVGFLTVIQETGVQGGYIGGYLAVNAWGRPLEFRLSTPVQTTKVHQILYGPTLKPYLFADLIGKTLVEKSSVPVQAVLCDCEELLELRRHVNVPVAWITAPLPDPRLLTEPQPQLITEPQPLTQPQPRLITGPRPLTEPRLITEPRPPGSGESTFRCHPRFPNDEPAIRQVLKQIEFASDLLEPFTRIREALSEARRAGAMNRAA